jgi:hypothetical protein
VRSVTVLPRPASPKEVGSARSAGSGSPLEGSGGRGGGNNNNKLHRY